jgi:membrane carboxypeptidase/penicillin-binding protein
MFEPTVFSGAVDNTGERLRQQPFETRQVITPTTAYMITDMLSDVIKRGTARKAHASFNRVAVAGKTGTSRDGWFVGYTPNLVCVVWVGFDDNEQLGMTGAEAALPTWIDFMKGALAIRPSLGGAAFPKPSGIVTVKIDPESGELAGPNCPSSQMVNVSYRYAPRVECFKHLPEMEYEFESIYSEDESLIESAAPGSLDVDETSEPLDRRIRDQLDELEREQREQEVKADRNATGSNLTDVSVPLENNSAKSRRPAKNPE